MRRASSFLWPLLATCTVETPVGEGSGEQVALDHEAWCQARCVELTECEIDDEPALCVENCVAFLDESFTNKGETCEIAGARLTDCFERFTCDGISVGESCGLSAEESRCVTSGGRTFCDTGWTGPNMGLGTPMECELGYEECSDGKEYVLTCPGDADPPECRCTTDGVTTGRFSPSRSECPHADGKHICGWPMVAIAGEPWSELPVSCAVHNSTVTDVREVVTDCEIWFDDCSDGNTYEIACGSTDSAACTCTINDMQVSTFLPMNAVCPFALDPDGGVAAMNYACGFRIAPPEILP